MCRIPAPRSAATSSVPACRMPAAGAQAWNPVPALRAPGRFRHMCRCLRHTSVGSSPRRSCSPSGNQCSNSLSERDLWSETARAAGDAWKSAPWRRAKRTLAFRRYRRPLAKTLPVFPIEKGFLISVSLWSTVILCFSAPSAGGIRMACAVPWAMAFPAGHRLGILAPAGVP